MLDYLFLTALVSEFGATAKLLGRGQRRHEPFRNFTSNVNGKSFGVVQMGIGEARARKAVRWSLEEFKPRRAMVLGVAGGLRPEVHVGDVVIASEVISPTQDRSETIDPIVIADEAFSPDLDGVQIHRGKIIQSPRVVTTPEKKRLLAQSTGALAVDMESYTAAQECRKAGVKVSVVRVISDGIDDSLPQEIENLVSPEGNPLVTRALWSALRRPRLINELMAMEKNNRIALLSMKRWIAAFGQAAVAK